MLPAAMLVKINVPISRPMNGGLKGTARNVISPDTRYYFHYKNKNWLQFLFIVKSAILKQQISKFYPQIQRTEASDHIYFSQRPFMNVKAIFCA